jgi:hypothetical protein
VASTPTALQDHLLLSTIADNVPQRGLTPKP